MRLVITELGIRHRLREDARRSIRECDRNGGLLFALPNRGVGHGADHIRAANVLKEIRVPNLHARRRRAERFGRQASVKSGWKLRILCEGVTDVVSVDMLLLAAVDLR